MKIAVKIAGLTTVRNEQDVISSTIAHLLDQGVDRVYVVDDGSTDSTPDILRSFGSSRVFPAFVNAPYHYQARWMNRLAYYASLDGYEFIVPFDADEWWFGTEGRTVREAIEESRADVLTAPVMRHWSWDYRDAFYPSQKVAYRWGPDLRLIIGNHGVTAPGLGPLAAETGLLEIREWQYRSAEHFVAKVRNGNARMDPSLSPLFNTHYRELAGHTDDGLRARYEAHYKREVFDPIPSKFRPEWSLDHVAS